MSRGGFPSRLLLSVALVVIIRHILNWIFLSDDIILKISPKVTTQSARAWSAEELVSSMIELESLFECPLLVFLNFFVFVCLSSFSFPLSFFFFFISFLFFFLLWKFLYVFSLFFHVSCIFFLLYSFFIFFFFLPSFFFLSSSSFFFLLSSFFFLPSSFFFLLSSFFFLLSSFFFSFFHCQCFVIG